MSQEEFDNLVSSQSDSREKLRGQSGARRARTCGKVDDKNGGVRRHKVYIIIAVMLSAD